MAFEIIERTTAFQSEKKGTAVVGSGSRLPTSMGESVCAGPCVHLFRELGQPATPEPAALSPRSKSASHQTTDARLSNTMAQHEHRPFRSAYKRATELGHWALAHLHVERKATGAQCNEAHALVATSERCYISCAKIGLVLVPENVGKWFKQFYFTGPQRFSEPRLVWA